MTVTARTPHKLPVVIRPMTMQDVSSVAALHRACLPKDFLPRLGERFLTRVYYAEALHSRWSTVLVAEHDRRIVGFVQMSRASARFNRELLRRRFAGVAGTALRRLVWNVPLALEALAIARTRYPQLRSAGELAFLAVAEEARQQAVGRRLVKDGLALARTAWGLEHVYVKISLSNPGAVALFMNRERWRKFSEVVIRGRSYVYLVWEL